MRQFLLMRQTPSVGIFWQQGRGEDVEWKWYYEGCVAPPILEMRFTLVLVVLYGGLVECVFSVVMRVLCFMGCGFPVARRRLTENWCP